MGKEAEYVVRLRCGDGSAAIMHPLTRDEADYQQERTDSISSHPLPALCQRYP